MFSESRDGGFGWDRGQQHCLNVLMIFDFERCGRS